MEIYVVKSGDTLYGIARRFFVSMDEIIYANQLKNPGVLAVGQALVIPLYDISHTVSRGESLYSIARRYGVSVEALLRANPELGSSGRIYPGQVLTVPRGDSPRLGRITVDGYASNISESTLSQSLPYLTFLSPFSYRAGADGSITPSFNVDASLAARYDTATMMVVTNLKESGGFSSDIAHALLTEQGAQDNFLRNVLATLRAGGYFGLSLDFEYVYPFDRGSFNQFLTRLADALHENGYILISALAPKLSADQEGFLYAAHDYAHHGATSDYVVLMTYEWGYTYGPAMAVSPINMVRRVLDYAVTEIPARKILMGVPNYGYNWTLPFVQGTAAKSITNVGAVTLAGQVGARIRFDETAQAPFFRYYDGDGKQHEVWFEDARSIRAKLRLVNEYGLAGISFWNLNSLFRTNFLVLQSMYNVEKVI
ncbi:MAG: LysM peptidoglycan-binding domain-containing protein [Butyricicoccus sp.]|nr:LysM peptidoglycan-binding domain-containing protein [Butyricicoccus sp.]